ncbi:MAG: ABC transporter permease subunit [Chloroflexota bacterium]
MEDKDKRDLSTYMPDDATFLRGLQARNLRGNIWRAFYFFSIIVAILALVTLFANVINSAFGSVATTFTVDPEELAGEGRGLADLTEAELMDILLERQPNRMPVVVRNNFNNVPDDEFTESTLREVAPGGDYPEGFADTTINEIRDLDNAAEILADFLELNLSKNDIIRIVEEDIVELQVVDAWALWDAINNFEPTAEQQARVDEIPNEIATIETDIASIESDIADLEAEVTALRAEDASGNSGQISELNGEIDTLQDDLDTQLDAVDDLRDERTDIINSSIVLDHAENYPDAELIRFYSWLDGRFLTDPMSSVPAQAGIRTALIGSLMMMSIVILVSLPLGVGAAIYLEEYADDNLLARIPKQVESSLRNVPIPDGIKRFLVGITNINDMIETAVRNLAGVPSIIYGMLGLAIFVRVLAPVTSGVAFGVNAAPPETDTIVELLAEPESLNIELELDDNYNIVSYSGPESISEAEAQELVTLFRRLGTPSIQNRGSLTLAETDNEIAEVLGIEIINELPPGVESAEDLLAYADIAAGFIPLDTMDITVEQFEDLAQQLRRVTAFTVSGRTILSAALTLSLLILPVIIISSQESLRAVPQALREASYGLGATKWQTIWRTVLPASVPGIMTGTIIAISRAVGETAPILVVGASTFLLTDPSGPFSRFTVLPIQIYTWTARPQGQFQFIAAAAIIVLLTLVLLLNATAIYIRNRYTTRG